VQHLMLAVLVLTGPPRESREQFKPHDFAFLTHGDAERLTGRWGFNGVGFQS